MLSAIILAPDEPARPLGRDAVARTLASLVEACVEGLVADAVLAGAPNRGLDTIADEAGCGIVEAQESAQCLALALELSRRDDVLVLLAGHAVARGFIDEVNDRYMGARALVLRAAPTSLITRLVPRLGQPVGLIARKSALREAATADLARLARRLRSGELTSRARRTF